MFGCKIGQQVYYHKYLYLFTNTETINVQLKYCKLVYYVLFICLFTTILPLNIHKNSPIFKLIPLIFK